MDLSSSNNEFNRIRSVTGRRPVSNGVKMPRPQLTSFSPSHNPEKKYHDKWRYKDLPSLSFGEIVDIFRLRHMDWFINPINNLTNHGVNIGVYGFQTVQVCSILIDLLCQWCYPLYWAS